MSKLVVREVVSSPYRLRLRTPFHFGTQKVTHREGIVVRVQVDGDVGWGEAAPLPGFTRGTLEEVVDDVARFAGELRGLHVDRTHETLAASLDWFEMRWALTRTAFSTAIADALARRATQPLHAWFGAEPIASVAANVTLSGDVSNSAEFASPVVKVKVGVSEWQGELERLRRLAERPDVRSIRLDANGTWSPLQARERLASLDGLPIEYVEQPVARDRIDELIQLAEESPVPIAADEALLQPEGLSRLVGNPALPVLIFKPSALGGPDVACRLGRAAQAAGQRVIVTTLLDGAVGRAMATHVAAALAPADAHGLATGDLLVEDLGRGLQVRNGLVRFNGNGIGVEAQGGVA